MQLQAGLLLPQQKDNINIVKVNPKAKVIITILLCLSYSLYYCLWQPSSTSCILDRSHELLFEFNRLLIRGWEPWIIGASQICIDFWAIIAVVSILVKVKTFRLAIAVGLFFGIRALLLNIQKFPFPDYLVWDSPGFPSLTVPYDHTRDFFYSGHAGILCLFILQLRYLGYYKMSYACMMCLLYTILVLLTTRVHYSIDVFGALIYAPFVYRFACAQVVIIDKIFSFPLFVGKLATKKIRVECFNKKQRQPLKQQNIQSVQGNL